jgi:RecB family exonuclease
MKNSLSTQRTNSRQLEKSEGIIQTIRDYLVEGGLSASSLNRYFDSPHEWYYTNVLKLREPKSLEIDAATFGNIVHKTIEYLYEPYTNRVLTADLYKEMLGRLELTLKKSFHEKSEQTHFDTGVNRLHYETALRMIRAYLQKEIKEVRAGAEVVYLDSEKEVERYFKITSNSEMLDVKVKGFIDHIERRNGILHLVDFKTGKVQPTELKIDAKSTEDLEAFKEKLSRKPKALQLLMYDWLYDSSQETGEIKHQIISLASPAKRDLFLEVPDRSEALELFQDLMSSASQEMLDCEVDLELNEDFKYASFS